MFSDTHSDYDTSDFSECVGDQLLIVYTSIPFKIEVECEQDDAVIEINRDLSCISVYVPSPGDDEHDERLRDTDQYESFILDHNYFPNTTKTPPVKKRKVAKNQRYELGDAYIG